MTGLPRKIVYDEMPNPDEMLELCNIIFYCTETSSHKMSTVNALTLEEYLTGRLFFCFRSNESLVAETQRQIH